MVRKLFTRMMTDSGRDAMLIMPLLAVGPYGNTTHQLQSHLVQPSGWSDVDRMETDIGSGIDNAPTSSSSYYSSLPGELQDSSTQHPGLPYTDVPDLWQAPVDFEWDQWATYLARFAPESDWT